MVPQLLAVVGPTATGKSDLAIALAQCCSGEIVNADAYALYQDMNIGTAKPTAAQQDAVRHHMIDVTPIERPMTVAQYQQLAWRAIDDIRSRDKTPVVVGGSGLYVRAALDALAIPPTDPQVRARWQAELDTLGVAHVYELLVRRDPAAAAAIEPHNARRIVRALEVIELTGQPFAAQLPKRQYRLPTLQLGLRVDSVLWRDRISARVEAMWHAGFVAEVQALAYRLSRHPAAAAAVGYTQILSLLKGELTDEQARVATVHATTKVARRQRTWFGADPRVRWFDALQPDLLPAVMGSDPIFQR